MKRYSCGLERCALLPRYRARATLLQSRTDQHFKPPRHTDPRAFRLDSASIPYSSGVPELIPSERQTSDRESSDPDEHLAAQTTKKSIREEVRHVFTPELLFVLLLALAMLFSGRTPEEKPEIAPKRVRR
jgi:hypothetical protein